MREYAIVLTMIVTFVLGLVLGSILINWLFSVTL